MPTRRTRRKPLKGNVQHMQSVKAASAPPRVSTLCHPAQGQVQSTHTSPSPPRRRALTSEPMSMSLARAHSRLRKA
eukprot:4395398-Pleurochrysis_carterae.AAC.4